MSSPAVNPRVSGMRCIRCSKQLPLDACLEGCPKCLSTGTPASLAISYGAFPDHLDRENIDSWMLYTDGALLMSKAIAC